MTTAEFKVKLAEGVISFGFTKKDGSFRKALGTRNLNLIPAEDVPVLAGGPEKTNSIPFWDLEKKAWRSVSVDSIVEVY